MNITKHTLRNTPMHRPRARLRHRSPLPPRLTLHDPSVIVNSSTEKPTHPCDDAHARLPFIDRRAPQRASDRPLRYKFQNTAP
jgi:hypothetical protein